MWDYYANTIFFLCYCFCLCLLMGNFLSFSRVLFQINLKLFHFYFFYGFMMLSLYFSEICCIWLGIFFGFCFDVYFLNTLGISFLIFPLLQIIFYQWNQVILLNRLTRFLTFLLTIFCFQLLASFLEIFFNWYLNLILFSFMLFSKLHQCLLLNLFCYWSFNLLFVKDFIYKFETKM